MARRDGAHQLRPARSVLADHQPGRDGMGTAGVGAAGAMVEPLAEMEPRRVAAAVGLADAGDDASAFQSCGEAAYGVRSGAGAARCGRVDLDIEAQIAARSDI